MLTLLLCPRYARLLLQDIAFLHLLPVPFSGSCHAFSTLYGLRTLTAASLQDTGGKTSNVSLAASLLSP